MSLKDLLGHPLLYQSFQEAGGWFGARVKAMDKYLPLNGNESVVDIGCGPGKICLHLPKGVTYSGFDPSPSYIRFANRSYGGRGTFYEGFFDDEAAARFKADVVMMNGVLHHMDDKDARAAIRLARSALKPKGRLFTLDCCITPQMHSVARWLISNDRGQYVREEHDYRALFSPVFPDFDIHVEHTLSRVPYTFIIAVAQAG